MSRSTSEPESIDPEIANRLIDLVGRLPHLVGVADGQGRLEWVNEAGRRFIGASPGTQPTTADLFTDEAFDRYYAEVRPAVLTAGWWSGELTVRRGDGTIGTVDAVVLGGSGPAGRIDWLGMFAVDITEQKAREDRLSHRASHDPLTGLPNRALLLDRLRVARSIASRTDSPLAVLALDLDGFKEVNDQHGHPVGDQLLQRVTARLSSAVRPTDTVARMGGDEFVVVLHPPEHVDEAADVAERIRARIASPPYRIDDVEVSVSASVGLTVATDAGTVALDELLAQADRGMYRAKRGGGDRVEAMPVGPGGGRSADVSALARALAHGDIRPVFDPVISLDDGGVLSYIARPHWRDPERGDIDDRVLARACAEGNFDEVVWWAVARGAMATAAGIGDVTIDLTLPARRFWRDDLADRLRTVRALAPSVELRVEVSEPRLRRASASMSALLAALTEVDLEVVVTDHGAANGLAVDELTTLPLAAVALDGELVARCRERPVPVALACQLASTLDIDCIAPGVEREDDLSLLIGLGVTAAQGPVTGGPLDSPAATDAATPPSS